MFLKGKLGRNFQTTPWAVVEGRGLFLENRSWKPQSLHCWGYPAYIIILRGYIMLFAHFLLWESGGPIVGPVWSDVFLSVGHWSILWILLCPGARCSILSTRWGWHYHWPGDHHLNAELNLTIVTGINVKADTSWAQMTVYTSRIRQWSKEIKVPTGFLVH